MRVRFEGGCGWVDQDQALFQYLSSPPHCKELAHLGQMHTQFFKTTRDDVKIKRINGTAGDREDDRWQWA